MATPEVVESWATGVLSDKRREEKGRERERRGHLHARAFLFSKLESLLLYIPESCAGVMDGASRCGLHLLAFGLDITAASLLICLLAPRYR